MIDLVVDPRDSAHAVASTEKQLFVSTDEGQQWRPLRGRRRGFLAWPTLTTAEASYTLGSATDTWGRTWSLSSFSNASFRVRVIDVASSTSRDFSLDWVAGRVFH